MAITYDPAAVRPSFSASAVTRTVRDLLADTKAQTRRNWLRAVVTSSAAQRQDLAGAVAQMLDADPFEDGHNPLEGLTIGEVGVCYEALMAMSDSAGRKAAGQYFTPDDAARFMAQQSTEFPAGTWMDPCCGVGNLSWHLAAVQADPAEFVRDRLVLVDIDRTALLTAVALIGTDYLAEGDAEGLQALHERAVVRDFLARKALPEHDYVIVNPPYGRTQTRPGLSTQDTREFFAYFLERVAASSRGFIAVTPASYLSAPKFQVLRDVLDEETGGGRVFVFDNVPDTLFRGYKFGSSNTSSTNFVRAAITVCAPGDESWQVTPIIRWRSVNRARVFTLAPELLAPRQVGPAGEWAKLAPELLPAWEALREVPRTLKDMVVRQATPYSLTVGMTPRYYISAAFRDLDRGSKATLHFRTEQERDQAALALNSSIPYLWWRVLDGGVTLPRRVLLSTPIPDVPVEEEKFADLVQDLQDTEDDSITTKLNAGRHNENVKRDPALVRRLNEALLGTAPDLRSLYTEDMAAS